MKPTLTGHLTFRSCRQSIKPTLAPPADSLFSRHSLKSENPPPSIYFLNISFLLLISETNKEDNLFQQSVKRTPSIITIALTAIQPTPGCITLTHNVRF